MSRLPAVPGLTPEAEALYRELLRPRGPAGPACPTAHAAPDGSGAAAPPADAPDAPDAHGGEPLAQLERLGLVERRADGTARPLPPRLALETWAAQRELEAVRARESADLLARLYATTTGADSRFAEILEGTEEVVRTFGCMQEQATERIRGFDRGSILAPDEIGPNPWQLAAMERGVAYHVVYESDFLQTEVGLRSLQASVRAGESARAFPGVPMKLVIADADRALISVPRREPDQVMALLVHPSMLLDAIVELFEAFWRLAVPVGLSPGRRGVAFDEEPTAETQRLLALLSAGSTDEAIARDLRVSERTVHRRVSRLQELLGARTRFQLGVQAARRGWL